MWVAEIDGLVVARLAWWSNPGSRTPALLDIFDIRDARDPVDLEAARRLLVADRSGSRCRRPPTWISALRPT